MWYSLCADAVVAVHASYVGFVVIGQLLIVLGMLCRWHWIRNPWFRCLHLLAILIVGVEAVYNIACPLTQLEDWLRAQAGVSVEGGSFVGRIMHWLIFFEVPSESFLQVCHIGFALLVLSTFFLAPPRWRSGGLSGLRSASQ